MIKIALNTLLLSSGKKFYAYDGVLSLHEDGRLLYGWDGEVCDEERAPRTFTTAEREEIADAMIGRWKDWKNPHKEVK